MEREKSTLTLDDLTKAPLKATGADIPEGTYPATLYAFGQPFMLEVGAKFQKEGKPSKRAVFEASFGIRLKDGTCASIDYLVPVPDGGATNRKSNLYKMLRSLGSGDDKLFKGDNFAEGVNLTSFYGKTCMVGVKKNEKDWPKVETISAPMHGAAYPTGEECKSLTAGSEDIPF